MWILIVEAFIFLVLIFAIQWLMDEDRDKDKEDEHEQN